MSALSDIDAVLAAIPNPTLFLGEDGRVAADNRPAIELFGESTRGRHYITALRQPQVLDTVERCIEERRSGTTRFLGTVGQRETTWQVTAAPVRLSSAEGMLLSFEDITAVEEAGQIRRDFVANVSHELRTPLTALLGFVETLRGPAREDAAARERFLGIMEREAGRMARLVEDLLSLSRVEENERLRPTERVDLSVLVAEVAEMIRPMAEQAGLDLALRLPREGVEVPGDAEQLRQVLSNLLENAVKYGRGGGRIELSLGAPAQEARLRSMGVRIVVRDFGDGIPAHHIPRLTERFYRIDTHRSREVGGTGLGLAIVKHIVNRHRGRLRIESTPGQGSTFTVLLPTDTAAAVAAGE